MNEADRIASVYRDAEYAKGSSRWDLRNPGNRAILAERRALAAHVLEQHGWVPLGERRVLDVGTGGGSELAWLRELGARPQNLVGVDLLAERIEQARQSFPEFDFRVGNAEHLDFPDGSFDLVLTFTIFTSILDAALASRVASEIRRVLRPGGGLLWYDFRYDNPSNRNVRGISRDRVQSLFPGFDGRLRTVTVVPQLARRLGAVTPAAYPVLAALPPLRTHLLGLLVKRGADAV